MAKVRGTTKGWGTENEGTTMVIESPNPNHTRIWIEADGHDKATLAPIFGSMMHLRKDMDKNQARQYTNAPNRYYPTDSGNTFRSGGGPATLALTKSTTYSPQTTFTYANNRHNNVDFWPMLSMDPTVISSPIRRITNPTDNKSVDLWLNMQSWYNWYRWMAWYNSDGEWDEYQPTHEHYYDGQGSSTEITHPMFPTIWEAGTDWISIITRQTRYDAYVARPMWGLGRNKGAEFTGTNATTNTTMRAPYNIQFCGRSDVDGKAIYLYNNHDNDYQQYVTKHNADSNNTTDLHYFSAAPTAAGTSAGGARTTTVIGKVCKYSSSFFDDPSSSGNTCAYIPFFDTNLDYHPFLLQWDKTTDTFTRNEDITITGNTSSSYITNMRGDAGDLTGHALTGWNETFVSANTRYLTLMMLTGHHQENDTNAQGRTFITYTVDAADAKQLTFHSTLTIPKTPKAAVFLNDEKTMLGIICYAVTFIYNWNNTTGWELGSTISENITALGRDSTDRIWANAVGTEYSYGDLHILTPSLPIRVTINPASSSYNYTGTNINSTVDISAYNIEGSRIATTVDLSIEGSTMTFSGGATTTSITTSTSAETTVNIVITGAGVSDIVADVNI